MITKEEFLKRDIHYWEEDWEEGMTSGRMELFSDTIAQLLPSERAPVKQAYSKGEWVWVIGEGVNQIISLHTTELGDDCPTTYHLKYPTENSLTRVFVTNMEPIGSRIIEQVGNFEIGSKVWYHGDDEIAPVYLTIESFKLLALHNMMARFDELISSVSININELFNVAKVQ